MYKNHRSLSDERIMCVKNDIQNPYKMGIPKYAEHMREIFDLAKYLPPSRNNEWCRDSAWGKKYITFKEYVILKAIKYGLTEVMQN